MTYDNAWYDDPDIVWEVAAWAIDESLLSTAKEVLAFFEKPHHYGELHDQWALWAHLSEKAGQ